jgi:signal transduction histidine kinase
VKRHSGADQANIRIDWSGENLHLTVSDRGKGFDSGTPPAGGGIGIWSMQERVRLIGGRFEIQSHPMQGTRIDAWLPFKSEWR